MKLTTRCGSAAVEGLNEALLAKAVEVKVLRTSKIRVDTTVVPANVAHPTDSALPAKAINRRATGRRIRAAGGAVRTKLRDRSRAAGQRAHDQNAKLRTRNAAAKEEALAVVRRKNAELARLAETAAKDADRLLTNAKRAIAKAKTHAARRKAEGVDPTRPPAGIVAG
jgi:IS5 family transposase